MGKNANDAHPERKRPHQRAPLGYTPGDSTTPFYPAPAVVIRDWATGVPPWKEGSELRGKGEKGDFYEAHAWSPANS